MKPVFMSNDGKSTFDTPDECAAFDKAMGIKSIITDWAKEAFGDKQGQSTNAINKIMAWEQVRDKLLAEVQENEKAIPEVA